MKSLRPFILSGAIALSLAVAVPAAAQTSAVTSAWNYIRNEEFGKARDAINKAIVNEKTMNQAKTWFYRAQAYRGISGDEKLSASEPDAAITGYQSLKKAIELNKDGEVGKEEIMLEFYLLSTELYNAGTQAYNKGETDEKQYSKAYEAFMAFLDAEGQMGPKYKEALHKRLGESGIDPKNIQELVGSSAQLSGNMEKALEYYNNLVNSGYKEASAYIAMAGLHKEKGDTAAAISVLDKGMTAVTDKKDLLYTKFDILVAQKKHNDVIKIGNEAIAAAPDAAEIAQIYVAMGNAYYEMQKPKEAEEQYAKALAKDPDGFNTNLNLGIALYEQGRLKYNASLDEKVPAKIKVLEDEYTKFFEKAIPYLEKAQSKNDNPDDKEVLLILSEMYSKIGNAAKAKEYSDKAKQ